MSASWTTCHGIYRQNDPSTMSCWQFNCHLRAWGPAELLRPQPLPSSMQPDAFQETVLQISPVLSMLRGLVEARSSTKSEDSGQPAGPKRVVMVWAARHKAEFTILDESVLAAARCGGRSTAAAVLHTRSGGEDALRR